MSYYFFIYFWLCWVFVSVRGLSLVVASRGHSSSQCTGLSLSQPLLLQSTSSRCAGSVVVAHGPSCSVACGIFPDQGSNPCPLHWQADSHPLHHQGSPMCPIIFNMFNLHFHLFWDIFSFFFDFFPLTHWLFRSVLFISTYLWIFQFSFCLWFLVLFHFGQKRYLVCYQSS